MSTPICDMTGAELSDVANQIDQRTYPMAEGPVYLAEQLIALYETPYACRDTACRWAAAKAVGVLARNYPEALDLVMESAGRYADLQRDIEGADPYTPNSIIVLRDYGPRCEKVIVFLGDLLERYAGSMASADVVSALEAMKAAA